MLYYVNVYYGKETAGALLARKRIGIDLHCINI